MIFLQIFGAKCLDQLYINGRRGGLEYVVLSYVDPLPDEFDYRIS